MFAGSRGSVCSLFCFDVIQMALIVDNSIVDMPVGIGRLQKSLRLYIYSLLLSRTLLKCCIEFFEIHWIDLKDILNTSLVKAIPFQILVLCTWESIYLEKEILVKEQINKMMQRP